MKVVTKETKAHLRVRFIPNCLSVKSAIMGAKGYARGFVNTAKVIDTQDHSGLLFERRNMDRRTRRLIMGSVCLQNTVSRIIAGFSA